MRPVRRSRKTRRSRRLASAHAPPACRRLSDDSGSGGRCPWRRSRRLYRQLGGKTGWHPRFRHGDAKGRDRAGNRRAPRRRRAARLASSACFASPGRTGIPSFSAAKSRASSCRPPRGTQGLRLRSGVSARGLRRDLRRDERRAEAWLEAWRTAGTVAPGPCFQDLCRNLPGGVSSNPWTSWIPAKMTREAPLLPDTGEPGFGVYRALALLRGQMSLLRFPTAMSATSRSTRSVLSLRFLKEMASMRAISGPKTVTSILPRRRHAFLDEAGDGRARFSSGISRHWHVPGGIEITMEANPSSVEAERFRGYRARRRQPRVDGRPGAERPRSRSSWVVCMMSPRCVEGDQAGARHLSRACPST